MFYWFVVEKKKYIQELKMGIVEAVFNLSISTDQKEVEDRERKGTQGGETSFMFRKKKIKSAFT